MTYAIVRQSDLQTIDLFPHFANETLAQGWLDDGQNVDLEELGSDYFEEINNEKGVDLR
jgi:hypothetical protein